MFDNPEKLIILLVIALLIFGPSKLAGFGGTLGRTIRDFRNAIQGARDEARETFSSFTEEASAAATEMQHALPAPDAFETSAAAGTDTAGETAPAAGSSGTESAAASAEPAIAGTGAAPTVHEAGEDDLGSLASEPTAEALRKDALPAGGARS